MNHRRWSALLEGAERFLQGGNIGGAHTLARAVYEEAMKERRQHSLGSEARWACTQFIGRAVAILAHSPRFRTRQASNG